MSGAHLLSTSTNHWVDFRRPRATSGSNAHQALVHMWARLGPASADHLDGPFAFAVSSQQERAIWLVRDPLGEAPLYYSQTRRGVWVADDIGDLLAVPDVAHDVDMDAVALRLARCFRLIANRTDFRAISKVPPGTIVRIDEHGLREIRYWQPESVATNGTRSFNEAVEEGTELLRAAARCRLDPDGTAAHVSGGLDSGVVAAVAAQELEAIGRSLHTLTTWSPRPADAGDSARSADQLRVRLIAERLGVAPQYNDAEQVLRAAATTPRPLTDPPAAWLLEQGHAARAADSGITTVLTGWGGDEGLSRHSARVPGELARRGRMAAAWRATAAPPGKDRSQRQRARLLAATTVEPWRRSVAGRDARDTALDALWRRYSPDIADARLEQQLLLTRAHSTREAILNRLSNGHLAHRNESWAHGGRRFGLTYAHPMQDRRVVEFALSLPPEFFNSGGIHRRIFRGIAAELLPAEVIRTPKVPGNEPAIDELIRRSMRVRLPLWREAAEDLGWPTELIDAWLGSIEIGWNLAHR